MLSLALGITGATAGVVIGGVVGALSHRTIWQAVPLGSSQARLRFTPVVSPATVGFRATLSFR